MVGKGNPEEMSHRSKSLSLPWGHNSETEWEFLPVKSKSQGLVTDHCYSNQDLVLSLPWPGLNLWGVPNPHFKLLQVKATQDQNHYS